MTTAPKKRRLSPRGSKAKGSGYERELAAYLTENVLGVRIRRALLSGGGRNEGGADLDDTPLIHVEAKRTERFMPYAAMEQAEEALRKSGAKVAPVVMQRRNHTETGDSLVVLRLRDFIRFYNAALELQREKVAARTVVVDAPPLPSDSLAPFS
jgi:Holliday junction resolvase